MNAHSRFPVSSHEADEDTCTIYYVQRRLGRREYMKTRLVRFVQLLIAEEGFPPPLPNMRSGRLVRDVSMESRWIRSAVDAWLDDFLPPDNAAGVDEARRKAAAAEMDEAARNLGSSLRLVGGRAS